MIITKAHPGGLFFAMNPPCNLCGSEAASPFCPGNGRGLLRCDRCGLVRVQELPSTATLATLYDASYFRNARSGELGYSDYAADESNIRRTARRRLAHLERLTVSGRLLDVGCALGFFVDEAAQRGWQAEGLEFSTYAVAEAQRRGLRVQAGTLENVDLPAARFDVLTLYDVIEHVPDPRAVLQAAARLLHPGGLLELTTPDVDSLPARLAGRRWIGYKLSEEHLYYFAQPTLRRLLAETGFEVIETWPAGKYVTLALFCDRLGFYLPPLARLLSSLLRMLRFDQRALYIIPGDIVGITARRA